MPGIRQSMQVAAPVHHVSAAWPGFLEWGLVGPRRLTCSELACVNAAEVGKVTFDEGPADTTNVVFELELSDDDRAVSEEELAHSMWHDLLLFKEYVEEHSPAPRPAGRRKDEHRPPREPEDHGTQQDSAAFSVRPTARP